MIKKLFYQTWLAITVLFCFSVQAQQTVSGVVIDASSNTPLAGANVIVKGTTNGVISDFDGNFKLSVASFPVTVIVSSVGFETTEVEVTSSSSITVSLQDGLALDEVVLVGNRAKPRTILDSPVPIDNISANELVLTGQPTVDKMLTYKVPSFNSSNQTISDATAHFDPADLRGLGPSRTLVLVNGKRKNQSALVYINDTPGKGEVGVDLKSIPAAAIERIEVLRDGASAQYGSDAIAGVINMVLKRDVEYSTINAKTGITSEGDGFNFGVDFNTALKLNDNGGFINFTTEYYSQEETDRSGEPGGDGLFGFLYDIGAIPIGAADGFLATDGQIATGADILNGNSDWQRANPDLGTIVGQPETQNFNVFLNAGVPFKNDSGEFYSVVGLTYRKGKSFALYRTPYWPGVPGQNSPNNNPLFDGQGQYQGFQPTFETDIRDSFFTVGAKWQLLGFDTDLSGTYGRNAVDYEVNNSINTALGANSPTSFDVGGYTFSNILANLDFSRNFGQVSVAFGAEIKGERFTSLAGELASYFGGGVQSFPGLQPSNVVDETRDNYGLYADVEWEPIEELLIGGAVRYEDFSDFGDNTSWKINARYSLGGKGAIRASYSTGFRAPSLHQIYLSNIQTLVSGGTISNQGTFNNVDPVIRDGLGVPQLTAETSDNISAGITYKPLPKLSLSLDYYNVRVDDRVLFTGEIGFDNVGETLGGSITLENITPSNPVEVILKDTQITSLKFFINAVNTETNGVDFVANYRDFELGPGSLDISLSANYNETKIKGSLAVPTILAENGYSDAFFNRKEQSRIISARPKTKVLLGLDYDLNKWNFILNNTYFGEVTWMHASNPLNDQTFSGKVITDLVIGYDITDKIYASVSANNLLDVYPDEIEPGDDFNTDLGGRFKYPWEVNQFGFNGLTLGAAVSFKF